MKRVDALETLRAHLVKPQHSILIGPRQVGKTTLVKQLAKILEEQGEQFYFLTFEDPAILDAVNQHPENIFNYTQLPSAMPDGKRLYIIIDEVQYANNPSNFLKLLYDKYKEQVKVIATGSSAFYIDKSFKDSLAGRKKVFELFPLSFDEFLHFKQEDGLAGELQEMRDREKYQSVSRLKINALFDEYLIYGGYPEVVLAETEQEKQEILKELVNSYMKKDALEAGIREEQKFFRLARLLADQAGNLVNNNELGNTLQLTSPTIENYTYILQKSFIINLVTPFYGNLRKELTKMPKVYFSDNGLRNVLVNNFNKLSDREDKGQLLENYVFNRLRKLYDADNLHYWRTADGNEVDFIVEQGIKQGSAYEVKFSDSQFKASKYQKFTEGYPGFELRCVSREVSGGNAFDVVRL